MVAVNERKKLEPEIYGRIIIEGKIELLSPAIIGSSESGDADTVLVRNADGEPYIPGSSMCGVLRNYFFENLPKKDSKIDGIEKSKFEDFWGFAEDEKQESSGRFQTRQSALIINDLKPCGDVAVKIRDGVSIDPKSQMAKNTAKYEYEVIEAGQKFEIKIELIFRKDNEAEKNNYKRILATVIDALNESKISVGAKTNSGFGRIKLGEWRFYEFDFSKEGKEEILKWLRYCRSRRNDGFPMQNTADKYTISNLLGAPLKIESKFFKIEAKVRIKSSLIVRSYFDRIDYPDTVHIKSNNKPVLPGTSIRGALRHRTLRILNTLNKPKPEEYINELFGYAYIKDDKKNDNQTPTKNEKNIKGKLSVEESIIPDDLVAEELQQRIKIDRFTGGTIDGALFDSMPLWDKNNSKTTSFNITLTIKNHEDHEAGLALLLLKDLMSGDLAIGGEKSIGRGVLTGKEATISYSNNCPTKEIVIKQHGNKLDVAKKDAVDLKVFVDALVKHCSEGGENVEEK
ncbi:MAG: hypothetical protein K8T10_19950 [Candidatus Eremiobacteraeota bacterium]|nr:hypothetical protein [Candidatus Eremiobacteraeota bacterium]